MLLGKIKDFDRVAELRDINASQWQIRYNLEVELEKIYSIQELHLKRQSGIKWTLKGDANNRFFHGAANGRRRRTSIFYLENDGESWTKSGTTWTISLKIYSVQKQMVISG
jgi:hypothetical protein